MKRDWDVIRDVLLEVEAHDIEDPNHLMYELSEDAGFTTTAQHALLLWRSGFLNGVDASSLSGEAVLSPSLTWQGHDLLDTLRSKPIWEKIKSIAAEKGVELTFDAVKAIAKVALASIVGAG
jgi:uncharacterized protein DUF2513